MKLYMALHAFPEGAKKERMSDRVLPANAATRGGKKKAAPDGNRPNIRKAAAQWGRDSLCVETNSLEDGTETRGEGARGS